MIGGGQLGGKASLTELSLVSFTTAVYPPNIVRLADRMRLS